jgi:hypothetical protein
MHVSGPITTPAMPSPVVRGLVSVLVTGHLFAILVAVTSYSSPAFPAPQLAVQASEPLQPYLQATFLNNAYRFFAPNPGIPSVFWFRVQFVDRSVRWVELPGRPNPVIRAPYQRRLNLSVQLAGYLAPKPTDDGRQILSPLGELLLRSCVRHVAGSTVAAGSETSEVRTVGVYCVLHRVIVPEEARAGWEPTDLRTYQPLFVGAYTPGGERVDEFKPAAVPQPIAKVVAGIIELDALPRFRGRPATDFAAVLDELSLPEPVHRLILQHLEIVVAAAPGDSLKKHIEEVVWGKPEGER